jgi:hypothetical protein
MRTDWLDEALARRDVWRAGPTPALA